MERLMLGREVSSFEEFGGRTAYCEFFGIVKKGHEECGDSAVFYADEKKSIFAVFDGVSGEGGAAAASSEAAISIMESLRSETTITQKKMESAIKVAAGKVSVGATTAAILFLQKDGTYVLASIGDSPIYGIDKSGAVGQEIPLARAVKECDSVLKFFFYRNLVTSVIGGGQTEMSAHLKKGRLGKNEMFMLASDGLSDNLYVEISEGYVTNASGDSDLKELLGRLINPESIVKSLVAEVEQRLKMGKIERSGSMLIPKEDDIAIICIRRI